MPGETQSIHCSCTSTLKAFGGGGCCLCFDRSFAADTQKWACIEKPSANGDTWFIANVGYDRGCDDVMTISACRAQQTPVHAAMELTLFESLLLYLCGC